MENVNLSTSGMIFMMIAWGAIIALNAFCFYKVLKKKKK